MKLVLLFGLAGLLTVSTSFGQDPVRVQSNLNRAFVHLEERQLDSVDAYLRSISKESLSGWIPARQFDHSLVEALFFYHQRSNDTALKKVAALLDSPYLPSGNDSLIADLHYRRGILYNRLGQTAPSLIAYKEGLKYIHRVQPPDSGKLARFYTNIGNKFAQTGDFVSSENYHNQALKLRSALYGFNSPQVAASHNMLGIALEYQHRLKEASAHYLKSIEISSQNQEIPRDYIGISWVDMADVYAELNEEQNRLEAILKGLSYFDASDPEQRSHIISAENSLGQVYHQQNQPELGLLHLEKALELSLEEYGPYHRTTGKVYLSQGDNQLLLRQPEEAIESYTNALKAFFPGFKELELGREADLRLITTEPWLMVAAHRMAKALEERADLDSGSKSDLELALQYYDLALFQVDNIRKSFSRQEAREFVTGLANPIFADAIELHLRMSRDDNSSESMTKAFSLADQSRNVLMLEALIDLESRGLSGIPEAVLDRGNTLELNSERLKAKIREAGPRAKITSMLQDSLFANEHLQEAFMDSLAAAYPAYFELKGQTPKVDLEAFQKGMDSEELVLEYVLGKEKVFIFMLSKHFFDALQFDRTPEFDAHLEAFNHSVSTDPTLADDPQEAFEKFTASSFYLYQKLLQAPVEMMSAKGGDPKVVTIIPDGELWKLPFEALLTQSAKKDQNYFNLPYAIRKYQFDYAWSIMLLAQGEANNKAQKQPSLLAIVPEFEARSDTQAYAPLNASAKVSREISQSWSGEVLEGSQAEEKNVKQQVGQFDILHLASHGVINSRHPLDSYIALNKPFEGNEDGRLHLYELYNLRVKARLAVLSACNSGSGKLIPGEGIASMARGLSLAGCPAVVMNLWAAQDQTSANLLEGFYEHLAMGESASYALHSSKLEYLSQASVLEAHPYYWAVVTKIGAETSFLPQPKSTSGPGITWLLFFGCIVLMGLLLLPRRRTSRKLFRRPF